VNYTLLALIGVAAAIIVDLAVLRTRLLRSRGFWTAYLIVLFFQLVTNGILTGLPVVRYNAGRILGLRIVYAPVEDLLFGFAMVTITLSLWVRLGARGMREQRR
jgi:lycopene cyclase domain-containing protein